MRRLVLLLAIVPVLAFGCRRPEATQEVSRPAPKPTVLAKPEPLPPNVAPAPQNVAEEDKFRQLKDDAEAALKKPDLRAAVAALEQALAVKDDAATQATLDEVRSKLRTYDEKRQRAAEMRKDPGQLEAAILALEDAKKAWDSPEVRREIDDYTLALLDRRDRVGVADFEVRGAIDDAKVGRTLAEGLLPSLQKRFDPVDCGQLAKVFAALKIQAGDLAGNLKAQPEVADVLKARYLVVGNVTRFGGWIVNARLVDLKTGLVVQTGKVTAATEDKLLQELAQLGAQLLLTDKERLAFEEKKVREPPVVVAKANENARIPPPPPAANVRNPAPVPPAMLNLPAAPVAGGLALRDLAMFPAQAPLLGAGVPALPVGPLDLVTRARLLRVAVDLGDQFLAVGRLADALRQYQFALSLSPGEPLVQARIILVVQNLPPGALVDPLAVLPLGVPRVVVFDFLTVGDPRLVPPWLGPWTADNLAPYFAAQFEVVDRRLAYWYMARLGLTLRDVAVDPSARFWLGRALNVRYFVFGALAPAGGLNATTWMVDAELNFQVGGARLNVSNPQELQLRLGELAQMTLMNPLERAQYLQGMQQVRQLLAQGNKFFALGNYVQARNFYQLALNAQPGNVEAMYAIQRTRDQEFAAARGLPVAQRMDFAANLLDRERRRDEILMGAGQQLALDRGQRQANQMARQQARQAVDQQAAQRLVDFAAKQLAAKQLTPRQRQQTVDLLQSAGRLHKNDTVTALLNKATPAPGSAAPIVAENPKTNRADFQRHFETGMANLRNQRYAPAAQALREALLLQPGHPNAAAGLKRAEDGLQFDGWMAKGRGAVNGNQFATAMKYYERARQAMPDDAGAVQEWQYAKLMQKGTTFLRDENSKRAAETFREARDAVRRGGPLWTRADQALNQADARAKQKAKGKTP